MLASCRPSVSAPSAGALLSACNRNARPRAASSSNSAQMSAAGSPKACWLSPAAGATAGRAGWDALDVGSDAMLK